MHALLLALALAASADAASAEASADAEAARAGPAPETACAENGLATGPLSVGAAEGDVGLVHRACPRSEVGLGIRPGAIIDTPGFYGNIGVALDLQGSLALGRRAELFAQLTAVQFRYLQNATVTRSQLALGDSSVGASYALLQGRALTLAPFVRVQLPTSQEYQSVSFFGVEPGVSLQGQPTSLLGWHAGAVVPLLATASDGGGAHGQALISAVAGGSLRPWRWFEFVAEAGARFGPSHAFDQLTVGPGLRFAIGELGLELGGVYRLAGESRWTGAADLRAAYRF